jgi:two-component system, NtrC family, sensor kinase
MSHTAQSGQSLGSRMVLATLVFCFVFTLGAVAFKTWSAWQINIAAMRSELSLIAQVYQHTLSKAIWEMDRDALSTHLTSASKVLAVGQIVITIMPEQLATESFAFKQPGWTKSTIAPSQQLILSYQSFSNAPSQQVGKLILYGDERVLWSRLRGEVAAIIVTQIIQSLLLAGFIMLIFNRSVTVHVQRIAHHLSQLSPANLDHPLVMQRSLTRQDELSMLVSGVNNLQGSLSEYLQQKQLYEQELAEHRDHLADRVWERTAELFAANKALANSAETLRQLGDIGKELTTSLNPQAICQTLYRHLHALLPLDAFSVALLDEQGDRLNLIFYIEDSKIAAPTVLMLDHPTSLSVLAFREDRELIVADDALIEKAPTPRGITPDAPMRTVVLRPLIVNSQRIGVVSIQSHSDHAFQERELEILRSTAVYAAIALANATAYAATEASREQTANALDNLRQAQSQLIQSEKMATLGQLIAGVAHEINTPIGAVKSSGKNIANALSHALENLPKLFQLLNETDQQRFMRLIKHKAEHLLSTREERSKVRALSLQLADAAIENPRYKAGILVQLHAETHLAEYLPLLQHPESPLILDTAYSIASIIGNTDNINMAVESVTKIIFALKSFSRFNHEGVSIEANLKDGLETVLTIYQNQIKQSIELIRNYQDIEPILCFPDELNQVWTNLIHNALQAMQYKGVLKVKISRSGNDAIVAISDNGCGIPENIRSQIFDVFFTTKPAGEGSGLGLDIVQKIIAKHHGRIEVHSEVGQGSCFTIYLPYQSEISPPSPI